MKTSAIIGYALGLSVVVLCAVGASGLAREESEQRERIEEQKKSRVRQPHTRADVVAYFDTDNDGLLSQEEYLESEFSRRARWDRAVRFYKMLHAKMDMNGDAGVSAEEMERSLVRLESDHARIFKVAMSLDRDGDYRLSREEAEAGSGGPAEMVDEKFDRMDRDRNGDISLKDELRPGIYVELVDPTGSIDGEWDGESESGAATTPGANEEGVSHDARQDG